jgi:hypothetical protein
VFLLAVASGAERVGVRLEDAQGLNADDSRRLTATFAKRIQDATGIISAIDERLWDEECDKTDRCAAEIRARTRAKEVIFLKAYSTATKLRLIADRTDERSIVVRSVQADLAHDARAMERGLGGFVDLLFPAEVRSATASAAAAPMTLSQETGQPKGGSSAGKVVAWSAVGAGGAAAIVATVLRLSANSTRSTIQSQMLTPDQLASDESSVRTNATASNLLFGAAAVLVVGALVYIIDH